MNRLGIAFVTLLTLVAFSCTDTQDVAVSPTEPDLLQSQRDNAEACHDLMQFICSEQAIFYAENGWYASSLEELELSGLTCPECELEYILEGDTKTFAIHCPLPSDPTHGSVIDGVATWPPDPGNFQSLCRANIRTLASQCVIFFVNNSRYPETLEEMGMGSYTCPECGEPYIYYTYENGYAFFMGCSLLPSPGHGFIDNGVASWHESGDCCANMTTIASQCVLFFAGHSRYPESLEEIGMASVTCPECGNPYIYYGDSKAFYVECGLPTDPNHGYIDNGVPSW